MTAGIPEAARPLLQQQVNVLRIIVMSLAMGVIAFGVYAVVQHVGKPLVLAGELEPLNYVLLLFGLIALVGGFVAPAIVLRSAAASPGNAPPLQHPAASDPAAAKVLAIQARIQTATIIGCAIFEGGAFANLFGYLQTAEALHLVLAIVLLLGILSKFPLGSPEERIERMQRRAAEADQFKR